jgi:DNA-binding beta-propeller fold protein YncE
VGGGVTGIASIVQYATHGVIKMGYTYFAVNIILLIIALFTLGPSFGVKTVFAIVIASVGLNVFQDIIPYEFIKQIALGSNPEQILLDEANDKAYITSPSASTIFVVDLKTMCLVQKIKINGYCEHIILSDGRLFYVDKLHNEVWAIELQKDYELRDIGKFPNISALAYANNKLFIASRTKSRIAIIDYDTLGLINEFTTVNKPTAMLMNNNLLYVLGSQNNEIQVIDTSSNSVVNTISLKTGGYSSGLHRMTGTNFAVVTDLKNNYYSILDLPSGSILKTYELSIPIKDVIIADRVRLFE